MIDGAVGLIVLIAAVTGAAKGIGDTIIRILGIVGGVVLGVLFSDKLSGFLKQTKLSSSLHEHIFLILSGSEEESGTDVFSSGPVTEDPSSSIISKSLGNIFGNAVDNAADKAADAAAERLTEIAAGIISFALIVLAIGIVSMIIRHLLKRGREKSVVLGFADRTLGFALGIIRGLLIAWIAVAVLLPVTAWVSPENTMAMADALQQTRAAKVLYDVNPFLLVIRYVFKA